MIQKIAFKPHNTRGYEIINILEEMGGVNRYEFNGITPVICFLPYAYYISNIDNSICRGSIDFLEEKGYKIYTIEYWEKENGIKLTGTPIPNREMILELNTKKYADVDKATEWLKSKLVDAEGHYCTIEFLSLIGYDSIDDFIEDFNISLLSKHKVGDFVGIYGYETDVRIQDVRREGSCYAYKVYLGDEEEWIYDDDIAYNCND